MTNTELLQQAYNLASVYLGASAIQLFQAIKKLEQANEQCNDIRTWEHIRDLRMRYADIDCLSKQMLGMKFIEELKEKKITAAQESLDKGGIPISLGDKA